MDVPQEFHYRLPRRTPGERPGSHAGTALGSGLEFLSHQRLFDRPDPRRLDLRASLADLRGDWLVRVNRQRAAIAVQVLVDVSASMRFGTRAKLDVVADFVESLGLSAFRVGDALGMVAFDAAEREDLHVPPWRGRGVGGTMAALLRGCATGPGGIEGLWQAAARLAGRPGLTFLVSDFHWPLADLGGVLDTLSRAHVVPIVVWDVAETQPPARDGIAMLADAETGARRTLWVRPRLRARWRDAVALRRAELQRVFASRGLRPFYMAGAFDAQALTHHFVEAAP